MEEVEIPDRVARAVRHRVASRLLLAPGAPGAVVEPVGGTVVVEPGWVSERFGERVATKALTLSCTGELPIELMLGRPSPGMTSW